MISVKVGPVDAGGDSDAPDPSPAAPKEAEITDWQRRLSAAARAVDNVLQDGPSDTDNPMYFGYASATAVWLLVLVGLAATFITLGFVYSRWGEATHPCHAAPMQSGATATTGGSDAKPRAEQVAKRDLAVSPTADLATASIRDAAGTATPADAAGRQPAGVATPPASEGGEQRGEAHSSTRKPSQPTDAFSCTSPEEARVAEQTVMLMVMLLGLLGGTIHFSASLGKYIGNRRLRRSWVAYYVFMPLEGAAVAPMIVLLLRVGVLAPRAASGSSIEDMNLVGLYAFSAMAGLFAKQAIEMLAQVFNTIFAKVQGTDGVDDKPEKK